MTRITLLTLALSALASAETRKTTSPQPPPPPDPSVNAAVKIAHDWQTGDAMPAAGNGGSVVYRYGAAMPPIVCAPERLTTILLQPGERIEKEPILGDTLRWDYELRMAGEGDAAQPGIIIKPKRPDIATDLVVFTNRRHYQFRLESRASDHLTQVEFSYPQDSVSFAAYKASVDAADAKAVQAKPKPVEAVKPVENCAYSVTASKNNHPPFTPIKVCDDGVKTTLTMPMDAARWDTAVLETAGPEGCETVNYRVDGDKWIVDRLFARAELVSGTGRHAQIVKITRGGSADPGGCSRKPKHGERVDLSGN